MKEQLKLDCFILDGMKWGLNCWEDLNIDMNPNVLKLTDCAWLFS